LNSREFLFEIGVEEIPAAHFGPACEWLRESFSNFIRDSRLSFETLKVSGTPRRFFVLASGIPVSQPDIVLERTGPALRIAYTEDGQLSPAALGFLKKNSASPSDVKVQKTDKGEFIAISIHQDGRPSADLLSEWACNLLAAFPFPKQMIWRSRDLSFSRPVRWLCALWGEDVLPLDSHGIPCGRITYGNRYLGLDAPVSVSSPSAYLDVLKGVSVVADREERLSILNQSLQASLASPDLRVLPDARLAETVCDLVEWPTAVAASFEERFLELPEKIITSTISQNQKYFSVSHACGKLSNHFVFISNGDPAKSDIIRHGNEKVVKARLADALWYFEEDCRKPLESYVPALGEVVFQARLGTMAAKVKRVMALSQWISDKLSLEPEIREKVLRTALLAKADLVTNMLGEKEFTKLQGYIGKQYALACGEDPEVAEGIWEHYAPRGSNDSLPVSLTGAIVAVADKVDTVCGIIGAGLMPTGSADPFALRRAANGVCQILLERGWELELEELASQSFSILTASLDLEADAHDKAQIFFRQRAEWLLKQEGIAYDVIDSLAHLPIGSLAAFHKQAMAIGRIKPTEDFTRLVIGFKRVANIVGDKPVQTAPDSSVFTEPEETALFEAQHSLREALDKALFQRDFQAALIALVDMGRPIDSFFDAVLVNCEDEITRQNRHALLAEIKRQFIRVADISRIVIETENGA